MSRFLRFREPPARDFLDERMEREKFHVEVVEAFVVDKESAIKAVNLMTSAPAYRAILKSDHLTIEELLEASKVPKGMLSIWRDQALKMIHDDLDEHAQSAIKKDLGWNGW